MVEDRLNLEPEVQEILKSVDNKRNFLLSGGAGSGKTYSLVSVIRQVISENPTAKVACMTYTNAAVKEIEERVNHKNLNVSTIHDFLWDCIKHFQNELKEAIISIANNEDSGKIKITDIAHVPNNYFNNIEDGIQYKEYVRIKDGIISHDELLIVANYLFNKYPKLSSIVKDTYKFIFIDEYQDTNEKVVQIFLEHFKKSNRKNIIGFFGDSMQNIYPDGIGDLKNYVGETTNTVNEIPKKQNRRNPQLIIDLANKLRNDGITQEPSNDSRAPNMLGNQVKQGKLLFLYSSNEDVDEIKRFLVENYNWNFNDSKKTKELNLTHNLIADKGGFRNLMDIYDRDQIINFKDRIKRHIKNKNIKTDFSVKTFGEVIKILQQNKSGSELRPVCPTPGMKRFIEEHPQLYEYAESIEYSIFSKTYINKDQLLDDKKQAEDDNNKKGSKRDNLIKHLFKIQSNISLYQRKKFNEFLRATDYRYKVTSIESKKELKKNIDSLIDVGTKTIEEIINDADEKQITLIDDKLDAFKEKNKYLWNRVKDVEFSEFQSLYEYLEGKTPFSTQHKTKGAEFNNVFVILDNGGWNSYNFEKMFLEAGTPTVLERTQKIFYVCCTRAKEKLAVFFHNPTDEVVEKSKEWFGKENVIKIE